MRNGESPDSSTGARNDGVVRFCHFEKPAPQGDEKSVRGGDFGNSRNAMLVLLSNKLGDIMSR